MYKSLIFLVMLSTWAYAVDLGSIDVNAKEESRFIEQSAFEGVFEEPEYQDYSEFVEAMPSQKRITKDEAMFIPGIQGDPIKAVQSLSGVTSVGDNNGELFIYGSKPEESITTVNHLPIGYLFHMGGLHSVIAPDAIEQIDAYLAGFDVTYGNAMGGVINVTPSYPDDELSGYGHMGLYDSSAGINVPVSKDVSFYLGVRRSYFDLLLSAVGKATGTLDEDTNTTYTEFPNYYDITFLGQYTPNTHNIFSLELISAEDSLEISSFKNEVKDPEAVGTIKAKYGFTTIGARHQSNYLNYESNSLLYYKYQHQRAALFDGYFANSDSHDFGLFHQSTYRYNSHKLVAGVELENIISPIDFNTSKIPTADDVDFDFTDANKYAIKDNISTSLGTLFVEDIYSYSDSWLLRYGLRYSYTDYNSFGAYLDPRASLLYRVDDANNISFSTGIYTQLPQTIRTIKDIGNQNLKYERADHYILHYDNSGFDGITFNIDGFYKNYHDLAIDHNVTNYESVGEGYAYGIDTNLKVRRGNYYAFAAYTYMKTERELNANVQELHRFYGEVPHTLQLIAGKKFWDNWALSTRMNYHSGTPYTKVIGTYTDGTRVKPIYENPYSSRLPDYFSLNVKIAQEMKLAQGRSFEWSFEIMNITNNDNISDIIYDDNYNVTGSTKQLPLLPWFDLTYRF
ncbi:TonB-dependent receptor plug domain-containing protein [Sulfurimonas aquatica]|uniref:TonB-dependent receptor plug domain-containing protein n=1 Tax=Sulfurimonas aquatica TaxID=2672570 RepID=A0A975GDA7_9BACT|nr:TonB-dependent receptor [Sulfurimonas aquatica]QSZ42158.1 TonB-dependent receptor plug domain-containing protein [Sulfurimonas aquatica]